MRNAIVKTTELFYDQVSTPEIKPQLCFSFENYFEMQVRHFTLSQLFASFIASVHFPELVNFHYYKNPFTLVFSSDKEILVHPCYQNDRDVILQCWFGGLRSNSVVDYVSRIHSWFRTLDLGHLFIPSFSHNYACIQHVHIGSLWITWNLCKRIRFGINSMTYKW